MLRTKQPIRARRLPPTTTNRRDNLPGPLPPAPKQRDLVHQRDRHQINLDDQRVAVEPEARPRLAALEHLVDAGVRVARHGLVGPGEQRVDHDAVVGHVLLGGLGGVAEGAPEEGLDLARGVVVALGDGVEAVFAHLCGWWSLDEFVKGLGGGGMGGANAWRSVDAAPEMMVSLLY